ncbi:DNA polymerase III subunit delta' [bacteria symbiont BFo1 of Frankliniella occidentalis]|jgi:DNA polymerase-3 subunit delta'|uniref:DNA polymerase III subunit delta' n=1 Tax=Erwinia aphidicola TaxID=68334 RepID=A0ABU8DB92_ERWAP|nr:MULTISPECIES: DNA polymerase III subunit delta' [Erwinia]KMV70132.1 DNA polymerase III subunit delta' [bacteria symbiont BFo1 of Frankliniella occidentalis]KYP84373.1 DNA polymerase III subunit delta' [bacteria symbiont BFo1 of Frankliniella occidentalis]KYP91039.1 DNA polymerase III subunit delta' [bacteria symbiont BFo1 of Frankliniella occidentalis]MCP2232954.1 DNA polymerase-3 subunit delta' [Erwinia aphidicola]MDI3438073.1 DNA polymerase III subunit delta' [Erwinia sp. V90_4]
MNWYPWLNHSYRQILSQHQAQRGHHALLIQALPGMGDDALAWGISRWLMCKQPDGLKSCGECHPCQLMQAGTHPDWYRLEAEKGKSSLGIDAVRNVTEKLWHHAQQGGAKVVWLPDAGQLTEAAANALLKTLEEPPKNTWFLLSSREPSRLLPTLRSRCLLWHLAPPDEAQSLQWLHKQCAAGLNERTAALRLASGAPAAALELLQEKTWQQRQQVCQALPAALQGDTLGLLPALNHDDAARRIGWLCSLLVDAVKWQQGGGQYISNVDRQAEVIHLASLLPSAAIDASLRQWMQCRDRLLNVVAVNRELLLTEQLLSWEAIVKPAAAASPN